MAEAEVVVVGAGPTGLAAALALAASGVDVVLVAPAPGTDPSRVDHRTTALLSSSLQLLRNLGVWERCAGDAAPLEGVRLVDDRGDLMRAPEITFRAAEIGLKDFGANIPNPPLLAAMWAAAQGNERVQWIETQGVQNAAAEPAFVRLALAGGASTTAKLVVAADGRNSVVRAGAGIGLRTWRYPQAAIATRFGHTRCHDGITTELHRRQGPLTTVPLPGLHSSLVWVDNPEEVTRLTALGDDAFLAELQGHLKGLLGTLRTLGPRAVHPLGGARADVLGRHRIALVGEAAHVIPPIGAQGLNLGLRDAAALADCVADARARGDDVGAPSTLAAYHAARASDVLTRSLSIDLLNRLLLNDLVPVQALRGAGLHMLANVPPLRRLAMQGGLTSPGPLPRLMRPYEPPATKLAQP